MSVYVHVSGTSSSSISTLKYDDSGSGTALWSIDHGARVYATVVDTDGNVYIGGVTNGTYTLQKFDKDGTFQWGKDTATTIYALGLDSSNNVFTGGVNYSGNNCRKYDSAGTSLWGFDANQDIWAIAVDSSGSSYFAGESSVFKKSSAGGSTWTRDYHSSTRIYGIAVDSSDNIYVCGERTSSITTRKFNSSGTQQWTADHGGSCYCIALDSSNNVYTGGGVVSSVTTRKYDSDGNAITTGWPKNHTSDVQSISINKSNDDVYTTGLLTSSITTRKYNSAGTQQWTINRGANSYAVYVVNLPDITVVPALQIPLLLAAPYQTGIITIPGLPVNVALATPTPTPKQYAADLIASESVIYRLLITGDSVPLYLPFNSIRCQRRLGASTWIAVNVPYYSDEVSTAIVTRFSAPAELVIYAGQLVDGVEVSGEFMRAVLTDYEITQEANTSPSPIILKARVVPTSFTSQSRTLRGVTARGFDGDEFTVKCDVDFLLRPNDTVDDGVQSWTARVIDYTITPGQASMLVIGS